MATTISPLVPAVATTPLPERAATGASPLAPTLAPDRIVKSAPAAPMLLGSAAAATALGFEEGAAAAGPPGWAVGAAVGAGVAVATGAHDAQQWQAGADAYRALQERARHAPLSASDAHRFSALAATYGRSPTPMAGHAPEAPAIHVTPVHHPEAAMPGTPALPARDVRDAIVSTPIHDASGPHHTGHAAPGVSAPFEPMGYPAHDPVAAGPPYLMSRTTYVGGKASPDHSRELNAELPAGAKGRWIYRPGETASARAAGYQEQITGKPWGNVYQLPSGKTVDGVRPAQGEKPEVWIEAKGPGFADLLANKDGRPNHWFTGLTKSAKELKKVDSEAATLGSKLEVHVAEKTYADALERTLRRSGVQSTTVLHTPVK